MRIAELTTRCRIHTRLALLAATIGFICMAAPTSMRSLAAQETETSAADAGQEDEEAEVDETGKRLDAIELAIRRLMEQVEALKPQESPAPAQEAAPTRNPQGESPDQSGFEVSSEWLAKMRWRPLGPANMGGRVTDMEIHSQDPSLWFIALASGGILKTENQGTTVAHQFDREQTVSIGAIATDPNDTNVVWVGTGEANPRNSVSYGNGVYKSVDGGDTWTHMGLDATYQISRILVDPTDSNTVYVGAAGRLYGTSPERGVYKTTDGGENWELVLTKDDRAGVIDMIMNPEDPNTLIVALWDRMRDGFDAWPGDVPRPDGIDGYDPIRKWGPNAGLYKTTDGGATWRKLENGLPPGMTGRIGLDWQSKSPHTIFAIIDCEDIGKGPRPHSAYLGVVGVNRDGNAVVTQLMPDSPGEDAGVQVGDVLTQIDGSAVQEFDDLLAVLRTKRAGDSISLQMTRGDETVDVDIELTNRPGARQSNDVIMGINGEDARGGGATLTTVNEGGPARQAGLIAGDVVKKVNDRETADYEALTQEIRSRLPGDEMTVTVVRNAQELEFKVTLGSRSGSTASTRPYTYSYFGQRPNIQDQQGADGYRYGGVYRSTDGGETWERVNSLNVRPMYFSVIRVDPNDANLVYVLGVSQFRSTNGGTTFSSDLGRGVHADAHDLWIDPNDGRHMVIGCDGGFYVTHDRGSNWDHINTAAVGQFYHVTISDHKPYWVFGGLQDNGSWGGPGISRTRGIINSDWISVGGGDGFECRTDREDPDLVYSESQNGRISRRNLRTGERASIRPPSEDGLTFRFNWKTPFILSNHNAKIFYSAGNYVWRSLDRGSDLQRISPEITLTQRGSATALAESPRDADVLYVGSDDGALWMTRDGGSNWQDITANLRAPGPRWVSTIEASRFADGRVYVCLDGHRSDDDEPYVYVSEDYGQTFVPIRNNLPWGSTRCLREDPHNPNLLYVGTEFAFWVSLNRGRSWTQFNQDLPSVAIHDVAVHPDVPEIVLATHGRSIWAGNVHALRQMLSDPSGTTGLLTPDKVIRWRSQPTRGRTNRRFIAANPTSGATFWYTLAEAADSVEVRIEDINGNVVQELTSSSQAGLQRVDWNLGGSVGGGQQQRLMPNGSYRVTLIVNGEAAGDSQTVTIEADPTLADDALADEHFEELERLFQEMENEEEDENDADRVGADEVMQN